MALLQLNEMKVASSDPVLSTGIMDDDNDIYGTFQSQPAGRDISRSKYGTLLRAVGIAVLMFATGAYVSSTGSLSYDTTNITLAKSAPSPLSEIHQRFLDNVNRDNMKEYLHAYASSPHSAGSEQDYKTVLYTAQQFESFGIKTEIKEYYTLLSLPVHRRVAIVKPTAATQELNLTEATVVGDACTTNDEALPPFLAYAASGNITSSIVYVNFATPTDFQWLLDQNVTLKGKIALIRYGGNDRGTKTMIAEQHGMSGVLIYSDPNEDGFVQGATYPNGPFRPEDSFQRGSIQYGSIANGDPLTPGWASNYGTKYLSMEECDSIPHIPALALSYGQAKHILCTLGGKKAPASWQGGLVLDGGYHVGDDEATVVNLDLEMDNHIAPIWDVIGTIEGSEEPDQQVLIGNHRDAWVCGAIDPNSGSSVMLELARGFGELLKTGWKPKRTIKLGSWDGEEYSLLGSTEYAEDNAAILKEQAVAYLNVDAFLGPLVNGGGTPAIAAFLQETAKAIPANRFYGNETEATLYEQWTSQQNARKERGVDVTVGTLAPEYLVTQLGAGTDFTPFYQFLGIVSAHLRFTLTDGRYGVYHSTMDSIMYSEKFGDPNYSTHAAVAQWWGLMTLRLADAEILPFDFSTYGLVMADTLSTFEKQIAAMDRNVDFSKLHDAIQTFTENANTFHAGLAKFAASESTTLEARRQWNKKLILLERYLINDDGLPHRKWFKHVIFGPGFYEGYAATAFPGIADSILFADSAATMQEHVDVVAGIVDNAAAFLKAP